MIHFVVLYNFCSTYSHKQRKTNLNVQLKAFNGGKRNIQSNRILLIPVQNTIVRFCLENSRMKFVEIVVINLQLKSAEKYNNLNLWRRLELYYTTRVWPS